MKVGPKQVIDKLGPLPLLLRPPRLVLKHHIIIPPPLQIKIRLVQQRIPHRNVTVARLLLGRLPLLLLLLPLLHPLPPDPLQLPLQLVVAVVITAVVLIFIILVLVVIVRLVAIVRVDVARFGEDAPPFGVGVFFVFAVGGVRG